MSNNSGKKAVAIIAGVAVIAIVGAAALYLVDVDQTQEARLPGVEVTTTDGQMPKFDVDVADVDVSMEEGSVTVPTVGMKTETVEVEVPAGVETGSTEVGVKMPTISVDKPKEDNPADNPQ